MSSAVKPRKTGLIVFGSRLVSIATGLAFLVMLTRSLAPGQFGLWEFIIDIVAFSTYPARQLTYWAVRAVARGRVVGKTTIVLSLASSVIGVAIYLAFAFASYSSIRAGLAPFLFAILLIPLSFWTFGCSALVSGYDPAIDGYSLLLSEPAKLVVAYASLFYFHTGIFGVILAVGVSYLVQGTYDTARLASVRTDKVDLGLGRRWLTDWQVPALSSLTYMLSVADTFVASVGSSGTVLTGYYQAAFQVATLVSYANYLSVALYPLLLRDRTERLAGELLEFTLLFAAPMGAGAIALAPQILGVLSPTYVASSGALELLAISAVLIVVSGILDQALTGLATADLQAEDRRATILRSDLMFVPAANALALAGYLGAVLVLARLSVGSAAPAQYALYWGAAQLVAYLLLVMVKGARLSSRGGLSASRRVALYVGASAVMAAVVRLAADAAAGLALRTLEHALALACLVALGAAVYFGIVLALDVRARGLARQVLAAVRPGSADA